MEYLVWNGGVRRYQNADGTYTADGRRRYIKDRTSGITDKTKRSKISKSAGKKYDKIANKHNRMKEKVESGLKYSSKKEYKKLNRLSMLSTASAGYLVYRAIIKTGARKIRKIQAVEGNSLKARTIAGLSLAAAGAISIKSVKKNLELHKENKMVNKINKSKIKYK